MKVFLKSLNHSLERWLCICLYLMVFVIILMEVIQRFVLSYSTSWGEEVARYSFIYLVWISAAMCVKDRIHLKIDLILKILPSKWKSLFHLFEELVTIFVACIAIHLSFETVLLSFEFGSVTDGLRVIKGIFLFAVPFGFSLILFRNIQNMIIDIKNIVTNKDSYDGKPIF